jgi:hypothetical protein
MKATRYVGLMVQGGYRYALYQQSSEHEYDGLYYSYGFTIEPELFWDAWHKVIKKKTKKNTIKLNN